jgi:hypothetical protein
MKKKLKNKESSRLADNSTKSKLGFLPLSPPAHQKSPQDSHFQSSSSPIGGSPPLFMNTDMIDAHDELVLQDLEALLASQEGESSSSAGPVSTNPCFLRMNQEQMDFDLYDILASEEQEEDESMLDFFPALPDNNTNG